MADSSSINRETLPQDLEAYANEARGLAQEKFVKRRPYPFLVYQQSNLWDRTLLLAAAAGGGGETRVVRYDIVDGGMSFVSPIRKRIDEGTDIFLGRLPGNDLVVPVASISGRHAAFRAPTDDSEQWSIIDLGSTNGTFLNDEKLASQKPTPIPDGDYLRLGGNLIAWFLSPGRFWEVSQEPNGLKELIEVY